MIVLRNVWVYLWSVVLTLFYAGRITLLSYVRPCRLVDFCDEAPRIWSKGILRAAGVKVTVEGAEGMDWERPQIVVCNHASWFDVFALSAYFPGVYHFVAKKELASIPVFGRSWLACGHIEIDRSDHASAVTSLKRAGEKIREDDATIIMFPEGTRTTTGELQRFKKGAFVLALEAGVRVVPVAIRGSRSVMPKGAWLVRPGHIEIRFGEPIPVEGLEMKDRDDLLQRSRSAIAEMLGNGTSRPEDSGERAVRGGEQPAEESPSVRRENPSVQNDPSIQQERET